MGSTHSLTSSDENKPNEEPTENVAAPEGVVPVPGDVEVVGETEVIGTADDLSNEQRSSLVQSEMYRLDDFEKIASENLKEIEDFVANGGVFPDEERAALVKFGETFEAILSRVATITGASVVQRFNPETLPYAADLAVNVFVRRPKEAADHGFVVAVTKYPALEGESWNRGNDIADGYLNEDTIERVLEGVGDVIRGERS